ncbi:MAG TPA: hypothetical protein VF521_11960, partial [Pyrinomonadaceae bacterium]
MRPRRIISVVASCVALAGGAHVRQAVAAPQSPAATTQAPPASQTPAQSPSPAQTPQPPPPTAPNVTAAPPGSMPADAQAVQTQSQPPGQLGLDEVLRLAGAQVTGLRQAQLNERVAEEDVRQARAAFLPKVTAPFDYIYTSPSLGLPAGEPR